VANLDDWAGVITRQRTDDFDGLSVAACIDQAGYSWGGPFRVVASDGNDYFVKCLDACPQGEESSLATELVVAGAGRLIGAPTCTTTLIRIPEGLAGWEYRWFLELRAPATADRVRALTGEDCTSVTRYTLRSTLPSATDVLYS
jgi:hypothetical protein